MESQDQVEMSGDERDDFLGTGGTGVISLSRERDSAPHSVPVSYGFDPVDTTFFFRLATGRESEKGELANRAVSFVAYGETDDGWRSVVAEGRLERTSDESISTQSLDGLQRVTIPYVDVFERPLRQVTFEFFRLDPDELTGRKEA